MAKKPTKTEIKYAIFVREYLIDENGTRAAIAAGYAENSAHVTASKLLKNAKVKSMLKLAKDKVLDKLERSAADIQREIDNLAFYDMRNLFNKDGTLKPIHELTYEEQKLITMSKRTELFEGYGKDRKYIGDMVEVKTLDRRGFLQDAAKTRGMFINKLEVTDARNLGAEMLAAQKRLDEEARK